MRRILRCAFVGLLSLVLTASGTTLGFAHISPTHTNSEEHTHHGAAYVAHDHHSHTGVAQPPAGKEKQPSSSHPYKNCCSACIVVSPLPQTVQVTVDLIVCRMVYSTLKQFDLSIAIPIDPGIPKRMG
jgi:hypothetical protein